MTLTNAQVNASGGNNITIYAASNFEDAPGGTINVSGGGATSTVTTVTITNSTLSAVNGATGDQLLGTGGTINITSNDTTTGPAPSPTPVPAIVIDSSKVIASQEQVTGTPGYSARVGGTINVTSKRTGGIGINVQNSSQLLALVDSASTAAGGHVNLTTSGGDVNVTGSTVRASGSNSGVTINTGTAAGTISVTNSTVNTADYNGTLTAGGTVTLTAGNSIVANGGSHAKRRPAQPVRVRRERRHHGGRSGRQRRSREATRSSTPTCSKSAPSARTGRSLSTRVRP